MSAMAGGITGSAESIKVLARALRELAAEFDDAAVDLKRLSDRSLECWWDPPGVAFSVNLAKGSTRFRELSNAITALAGEVESAAIDLTRAMDLMTEAYEIGLRANLEMSNGWTFEPPMPNDTIEMGMPAYDRETSRQIYVGRVATYRQAEATVNQASQIVLDRLRELGYRYQFDWTKLHFSSADIAAGETIVLAKWMKEQVLAQGAQNRHWGSYWLEQAKRTGGIPVLEQQFLQNAAGDGRVLLGSTYRAQNLGFVARVLGRVGGPVIAIAGVAYEIWQGQPPDKSIFTGGVGIGVGLLLAAAIPGAGWGLVLVVAGASLLAGELVGLAWDLNNQPSAAERLFGE